MRIISFVDQPDVINKLKGTGYFSRLQVPKNQPVPLFPNKALGVNCDIRLAVKNSPLPWGQISSSRSAKVNGHRLAR